MRVTWCGRSVTGMVRGNNEDSVWAAPLGGADAHGDETSGEGDTQFPGLLLAVADGMGGALAGEVASGLAVETLGTDLARRAQDLGDERGAPDRHANLIKGAVEAAHSCIRGEGASNPQRHGMGTTLTAMWLLGKTAEITQVGDSRAYLFRKGYLRQLTKDQSLVGKLIEDGIITEEEGERMAGRNIILQALGTDEPLDVVHTRESLEHGDILMLCTDGLSGVVNNHDIEEELRKGGEPAEICARLVGMANGRGGPDNITVLLARASA